jgi:hypothetical protein
MSFHSVLFKEKFETHGSVVEISVLAP